MLLYSLQVTFIAHLSILGRRTPPLWVFLRFVIFPVRIFSPVWQGLRAEGGNSVQIVKTSEIICMLWLWAIKTGRLEALESGSSCTIMVDYYSNSDQEERCLVCHLDRIGFIGWCDWGMRKNGRVSRESNWGKWGRKNSEGTEEIQQEYKELISRQ